MKQIIINQIYFQCNYCITREILPSKCLEHEKSCNYNPDNKTCFTCINYVEDDDPTGFGYDYCNIEQNEYHTIKIKCKNWKLKKA